MKELFLYLLIIASILLLPSTGHAQQKETTTFSIGTTPLNLFEPVTSTLEVVLDVNYKNIFELEAKYGTPLGVSVISNGRQHGTNYYDLKFGAKYFYHSTVKQNWSIRQFLVIEYFQFDHKYESIGDYLSREGQTFTYDTAQIRRSYHGLRLRNGIKITTKCKLMFELYHGIGFRKVDVRYNTVNETEDFSTRHFDLSPARKVGKATKPDFVFGCKISYPIFSLK